MADLINFNLKAGTTAQDVLGIFECILANWDVADNNGRFSYNIDDIYKLQWAETSEKDSVIARIKDNIANGVRCGIDLRDRGEGHGGSIIFEAHTAIHFIAGVDHIFDDTMPKDQKKSYYTRKLQQCIGTHEESHSYL